MERYIDRIYSQLEKIRPYKVILFGSRVSEDFSDESDIDLIVVTNDEVYPDNYREHMNIYHKVSDLLTEIIMEKSIDLLVYTKPMYKKFIELNSMFAREISQKGKIIYEANSSGVA
ncbi:nucleotidyltransferase domain-containing protein [Bacteroidota bacterium]